MYIFFCQVECNWCFSFFLFSFFFRFFFFFLCFFFVLAFCWGRSFGVFVGVGVLRRLRLRAVFGVFVGVVSLGSLWVFSGVLVCFWLLWSLLLALWLLSGRSLGSVRVFAFGSGSLGLAFGSCSLVLLWGPSFGSGSLVLGFLAGPLVLVWLRFLAPGFLAGPLGLVWLRFLAPGFWFGPLVLVGSGFGAGFWFGPRVWFGAGLLVGSGSFGWLRLFWFLGVFFPRCLVFAGGWFLVFFF